MCNLFSKKSWIRSAFNTVNTGGFDAESKQLAAKAAELGIEHHLCLDVEHKFYDHGIRFLLFYCAKKPYYLPLSVSAERVFQAVAIANMQKKLEQTLSLMDLLGLEMIRFDLIWSLR